MSRNDDVRAIHRSGGALPITDDGRPLYAYTAHTAPGQANGNGVNASGGTSREVTASGAPAPLWSSTVGGSSGGSESGY
jgi:hypothetical protein